MTGFCGVNVTFYKKRWMRILNPGSSGTTNYMLRMQLKCTVITYQPALRLLCLGIYYSEYLLKMMSPIMTPAALPQAEQSTNNFYMDACKAVFEAKQRIEKYPDHDECPIENSVYARIMRFFSQISDESLAAVKTPHINTGSSGQLCLDWLLPKGELNLLVWNDHIEGVLHCGSGSKTCNTDLDAIALVDSLAETTKA
jgi:hypothetical protein